MQDELKYNVRLNMLKIDKRSLIEITNWTSSP